MEFNTIDWAGMWKEQSVYAQSSSLSRKETWDKRADRYSKRINQVIEGSEKLDKSDYIYQMLERIEIQPEWSVLDIGSGPGTLTIPLAKKAKRITALDISSEMLKHLQRNAENNGLDNIRYVNTSWEEAFVSNLIESHDVVVASRSLMTEDMYNALSHIIRLAQKAAYLTYPVIHLPFDWEVYRVVGRKSNKHPPYIYLYNMLFQMGIDANVEILNSDVKVQFSSFDQMLDELQHRNEPFSSEETAKLKTYWDMKLAEQKGNTFTHEGHSKWALIWWKNP